MSAQAIEVSGFALNARLRIRHESQLSTGSALLVLSSTRRVISTSAGGSPLLLTTQATQRDAEAITRSTAAILSFSFDITGVPGSLIATR